MSEQLVQAISDKYGVSQETGQQVVNALVEVEKHRQASTSGARAVGQTPDIMSIVGSLLGGGQQGNQGGMLGGGQQQGNQGGDLMGMVGSLLGGGGQQQGNQGGDLMGMIGSLLGGGQPQGGHNMVSILGDLLGGASHPSQAPDLMSIVGGLLGGQQPQGGNLNNMVNNLMSNAGGQSTLNHPTQQQLNQAAQHANPMNVPKPSLTEEEIERKRSDFGAGGGQKPGH